MNEYKLFEAEPGDWIVNVAIKLHEEAKASLPRKVYLKFNDQFIRIPAEMSTNDIVELYDVTLRESQSRNYR